MGPKFKEKPDFYAHIVKRNLNSYVEEVLLKESKKLSNIYKKQHERLKDLKEEKKKLK